MVVSAVAWPSGNVVRRTNEVDLRRARLVLGWVTARRYFVLPLIPTRPAGREVSTGQGAVLCVWEGNRRSAVALGICHVFCDTSAYTG